MVMKVMRAGTKPVLWIVVAAFLGTIIFAWGMDFTRRPAARGIVGEVNGVELKLDDYSFLYQNAITQRQQQSGEVSEDEARQLRDQVFEQMVQNQILSEIITDAGLSVTNPELAEHIKRFPPAEVQQAEFFRTNGQFDYNKYLQAYSNPDPQLSAQVEAIVRPRVLQQKLYEYVTAAAIVDDTEVRELYDAASEKVAVRYVLASVNTYRDSIVPIDTIAALTYFDEHQDEYRHEARAKLMVALFSKTPSADDSAIVLVEAEDLVDRARAGEDFAELAATYSEDDGSPGGGLGWFGKGAMVAPFEEAAFALDSGAISDPVLSQFGYHVIQCQGRRGFGDSVEVNASHILLRIEPSPSSLSDLRLQAEQFADEAKSGDFEAVAESFGIKTTTTSYFERDKPTSVGVTSDRAVVEFAFNSEVGAVSLPVETPSNFAVVKTVVLEPAGLSPFDEVRSRIFSRLRTDAAKDVARAALAGVAADAAAGSTLTEAADKAGFKIDSTALFGRLDNVAALANDPTARGMAFALTSDAPVSPIGTVSRGAVILELINRTAPDPALWAEKRDSISTATLGVKRQITFNSWFAQVRDNADVKDYRYQLPTDL